jgi:hypothetical protein
LRSAGAAETWYVGQTMQATFILAEHVSSATFDRFNFDGCIVGDKVTVPQFPYRLQTTIVGFAQRPDGEALAVEDIVIRVAIETVGIDLEETEGEVEKIEGDDQASRLMVSVPIECWLLGPSTLRVSVSIKNKNTSYRWHINHGHGPLMGLATPGITSAILGATAQTFDVCALLASATTDLVIVDAYLPPSELLRLIASVPPSVKIQLLVPPKDRQSYRSANAVLYAAHGRLDVRVTAGSRSTGPFHDRFVIINSSEVYWFGTSLKQVMAGRVTRVAKLFGRDEVATLQRIFASEWSLSTAP